jgi:hypothetical protein
MTFAHVGGLPLEETLAASGPALLTALGAAAAQLRARRFRRHPAQAPSPPVTRPTARDRDAPDLGMPQRAR